jgi:hypothetical protein
MTAAKIGLVALLLLAAGAAAMAAVFRRSKVRFFPASLFPPPWRTS